MVRKHFNPQLKIEASFNDVRCAYELRNEVKDDVIKYFREKVYKTPIPRNVRLSEALSYGQAIATTIHALVELKCTWS